MEKSNKNFILTAFLQGKIYKFFQTIISFVYFRLHFYNIVKI